MPSTSTGMIHTLMTCQLFAGMPEEELKAVAKLVKPLPLDKGQYLFHEGEQTRGFFVVQSGTVSVHRISASGKEQAIHSFQAGDSFAEATLSSPQTYPAHAKALEAGTVLLVPREGFLDLIRRKPELSLRMLGAMSTHLRVLVGLVEDLTQKDVETRLKQWLLSRCASRTKGPQEITLDSTKRQLASSLSTTSETLSRSLARLRKAGLVELPSARKIIVTDPTALQAQNP